MDSWEILKLIVKVLWRFGRASTKQLLEEGRAAAEVKEREAAKEAAKEAARDAIRQQVPPPVKKPMKPEKPFIYVPRPQGRPPGEGFWAVIVNRDYRRTPELYGTGEVLPIEYDYWTKAHLEARRAADARAKREKIWYRGVVIDKDGLEWEDSPDHPNPAKQPVGTPSKFRPPQLTTTT